MEDNNDENKLDDLLKSSEETDEAKDTLDDLMKDLSQINDTASSPEENTLDQLIPDDIQSEESSKDDLALDELVKDIPPVVVTPSAVTESTVNTPEANVAPRPKLKKIKRLKIRPMSDTPVAPAKAEPVMEDTNPVEHTDTTDDFQDDFQDAPQGTNLITSSDAKDVSQENNFDNSYVLEDLPPELDYVIGDDSDASYQTSGVMAYKKPLIIALCCFLFGMFLGASFFSTKVEEKHGLEYVVLNPDVPQGRARCGLTAKDQACIFYIMNCYKQELTGRDFFKLAATLTGREEYMIESENLRYATTKIKPGAFAQLNIPALK